MNYYNFLYLQGLWNENVLKFKTETGALEASEVASLLCKEGLFKDACSLLSAHKIDVAVPIKLLARKYACQISRPDGEELQTQLEGK